MNPQLVNLLVALVLGSVGAIAVKVFIRLLVRDMALANADFREANASAEQDAIFAKHWKWWLSIPISFLGVVIMSLSAGEVFIHSDTITRKLVFGAAIVLSVVGMFFARRVIAATMVRPASARVINGLLVSDEPIPVDEALFKWYIDYFNKKWPVFALILTGVFIATMFSVVVAGEIAIQYVS